MPIPYEGSHSVPIYERPMIQQLFAQLPAGHGPLTSRPVRRCAMSVFHIGCDEFCELALFQVWNALSSVFASTPVLKKGSLPDVVKTTVLRICTVTPSSER